MTIGRDRYVIAFTMEPGRMYLWTLSVCSDSHRILTGRCARSVGIYPSRRRWKRSKCASVRGTGAKRGSPDRSREKKVPAGPVNVTLHRPQYVALARCSDHSAEPTEKAASAHHRDGAESTGSHSGHSGVISAITTDENGQTAGCYGHAYRVRRE